MGRAIGFAARGNYRQRACYIDNAEGGATGLSSIISPSSALLDVRNRNEAQSLEQRKKEEAARMGLPTDNIHVEPGTVDWLYGENMPEPNMEEDDEDNECSLRGDVDDLPMIKARDTETEEGIFSSGKGTKQEAADIFMLEGRETNYSVCINLVYIIIII